jgi:predicted MFS family arabinose efflux permease
MFLGLLVLGIANVAMAIKIGKFANKAILTFYLSSLSVVCLRTALFLDPLASYSPVVYVVALVTLPSYLYLVTGLSQVMLSVDNTFQYKDLEVH